MLNQRGTVAGSLGRSEQDIDNAIASAAELIAHLLEDRSKVNLPVMVGQQALESLGAAVTTLIRSRREMIETRETLNQAAQQTGLRAQSFEDQPPMPTADPAEAHAHHRLHVVK